VGGLETVGFDKLLIYLANKDAADNICEDSTRKEVTNKLELAKKLAIGAVTPPIKAEDIYGKSFDLMKVTAPKTVLVFWASWCPHCTETLPELKQIYEASPGKFEVVAVSVDEDVNDAKNAIENYGFNWINIAEGMGWDGKIPLEYGIAATPTFFILDKEKKIISKPRNMRELKQALALP
jgi:thiol-disulfide isomerase/thioredoxin